MSFKIFTDSSANVTDELIEKYDIGVISLYYLYNNELFPGYVKNDESAIKKFYELLRNKSDLTTSCANKQAFLDAFEPSLDRGEDILYLGFSSGLSETYNQGVLAINELKEKYPNQNIIAVDTLNASLGEGLIVVTACRLREEGKSLNEVVSYIENTKLSVNSLFTVKTLSNLAKGGRISKATYFVGTAVDVKPTMRVNVEGKLVSYGKVIGRKRSLMALADTFSKKIEDIDIKTVCISHGDCFNDAKTLEELIRKKANIQEVIINYVDPTIAVHSGPDTLALFFYGEKRID